MHRITTSSLLFIALFFNILSTSAQETNLSKFGIKLSGFIAANAIYDSRQSWNTREGFVLLYPKNIQTDPEGNDVNGKAVFNQYAMSSRLKAVITGPDAFGAKVSGVIESDFTGASSTGVNEFRLRHAYLKLTWPHSELLAGQYWHPLDVGEMNPEVISLNTGAPFHSHSRYPQLRFTQSFKRFNVIATAVSQRDNADNGPKDITCNYQANSGIPNLDLQIQYKTDALLCGIGGDFKRIIPRLETSKGYKANETLNTFAAVAFIQYKTPNMSYRLQSIYGGNLYDHVMPGGYGVTSVDALTDRRSYAGINYLTFWGQIVKNTGRIQPAIYLGFAKNEGSGKVINPNYTYGRALDVDYLYRISPQIKFVSNKVWFGFEGEYTDAAFGKNTPKFKVTSSNDIGIFRLTGIVCFIF